MICKIVVFNKGKIKIHIEKKFQNNRLSIYDIESFTEYIKSLSLSQFFAIIDNYFVTLLIFEVQDNYFHNWATNSIAFVSKNSLYNLAGIGSVDRVKRINEARSLCYCEIKKYNFLPEDLFNSELDENNPLQLVFAKACVLYMYSFIFDYSSIKEDIYEYKLNAFKSLKGQLNVVTLPIGLPCMRSRAMSVILVTNFHQSSCLSGYCHSGGFQSLPCLKFSRIHW